MLSFENVSFLAKRMGRNNFKKMVRVVLSCYQNFCIAFLILPAHPNSTSHTWGARRSRARCSGHYSLNFYMKILKELIIYFGKGNVYVEVVQIMIVKIRKATKEHLIMRKRNEIHIFALCVGCVIIVDIF